MRCRYREVWQSVFDDLLAFFADRLKVHLREQGVRHDLIAAVFAGGGVPKTTSFGCWRGSMR